MNKFGNLDFGNWLYGLGAAFIGGGAGAVTSGISAAMIAPDKFNMSQMHNVLMLMGCTFLMTGLLNGLAFLHQQPLPAMIVNSRTVQTTQSTGEAPTTVTTVQTATVKPVDPGQ